MGLGLREMGVGHELNVVARWMPSYRGLLERHSPLWWGGRGHEEEWLRGRTKKVMILIGGRTEEDSRAALTQPHTFGCGTKKGGSRCGWVGA